MYFELVHDQKESWRRDDLLVRLGDRASRFLIARALDRLESIKRVKRTIALNELARLASGDDGSTFDFTDAGFAQAEADYHSELSTKGLGFDELYAMYTAYKSGEAGRTRTTDLEEGEGAVADQAASNVAAIPASDRVVRLDDNAPGRLDAIKHLDDLSAALTSRANDLPLDSDERSTVASEIKPCVERLRSGRIRVGEIASAVTKGSPLVWLTEKLAGLAIGALATAAIGALWLLLKSVAG